MHIDFETIVAVAGTLCGAALIIRRMKKHSAAADSSEDAATPSDAATHRKRFRRGSGGKKTPLQIIKGIFAAGGVLLSFVAIPKYISNTIASRFGSADGGSTLLTFCPNNALRAGIVASLVSGAVLTVITRLLHSQMKTAVLFLVLHIALSVVILSVVGSTFLCKVTSNPVLAHGSKYLVMGILLLVAGHTAVISYGRMMPAWYRHTVSSLYSALVTSSFILFFFSPLIARIPGAKESYTLFAAVLALSFLGVLQSSGSPRPLDKWEHVSLSMDTLIRVANDSETVKPFHVERTTIGDAVANGLPRNSDVTYENTMREAIGLEAKTVKPLGATGSRNTLTIVQLTDVHLGTFVTPESLRKCCQDALLLQPDLIFLTGDFFTAEVHRQADALPFALEPLKALKGRVFACYGNHDMEHRDVTALVDRGLAACDVTLLRDEAALVDTRVGLVEVIGLRFYTPFNRKAMLTKYFESREKATSPRRAAAVQTIVMLHDPSGFDELPELGALVLSGHTHGGHIGLFSFGFPHWTLARLIGLYDNGVWCGKGNVLYVHRGQGARSLLTQAVTRLGVPSEDSVLRVVVPSTAPSN